ncbi:hypothetical protein BDV06DRAFT_234794 [Aspergillus oleicola]
MSRYTELHLNPSGPGDSRPTALDIIRDNDLKGKLSDKVAVITGVTAGLGIEVVRALAETGITLYLTARDIFKAQSVLADIITEHGQDKFYFVQMDQSSLSSVRAAAAEILSKTTEINILICNAGIMCLPELTLNEAGHEMQFATNHLSHFLLFNLLRPVLEAGASRSPDFHSRVVMVSASAHRAGPLQPSNNYHFQQNGSYSPWPAYAQSKLANIYMANEISRRFGDLGIHGLSLHPGIIPTGLSQHVTQEALDAMMSNQDVLKGIKSVEQGAATTVYAALDGELEGVGGKYLVDCGIALAGEDDGDVTKGLTVSWTYDEEAEGRLWGDSVGMVGLDE